MSTARASRLIQPSSFLADSISLYGTSAWLPRIGMWLAKKGPFIGLFGGLTEETDPGEGQLPPAPDHPDRPDAITLQAIGYASENSTSAFGIGDNANR